MIFSVKNYDKLTPKKILLFADSVTAGAAVIAGSAVVDQYPIVAILSIFLMAIAQGVSRFFASNNNEHK